VGSDEPLEQVLTRHTPEEGIFATACRGLMVARVDRVFPRFAVLYPPCLCVVVQGRKRAFFNDEVVEYYPRNHLVSAMPVAVEAEIVEASRDAPYLALILEIDLAATADLLIEMSDHKVAPPVEEAPAPILFSTPTPPQLHDAVDRLVRTLDDPADSQILAPGIVKEVMYHLLRSQKGPSLRSLVVRDTSTWHVTESVRYLNGHLGDVHDIRTLARRAGMGESTFHRAFKGLLGESPMQYLKKIRLHRARQLIIGESMNVAQAADHVGYNSASQFSREFNRLFDVPPSRAAQAV